MSKRKLIIRIWLVGGTFIALAIGIVLITRAELVTLAAGRLMLIALFGLYVGVGILVGAYRLIHNLR